MHSALITAATTVPSPIAKIRQVWTVTVRRIKLQSLNPSSYVSWILVRDGVPRAHGERGRPAGRREPNSASHLTLCCSRAQIIWTGRILTWCDFELTTLMCHCSEPWGRRLHLHTHRAQAPLLRLLSRRRVGGARQHRKCLAQAAHLFLSISLFCA